MRRSVLCICCCWKRSTVEIYVSFKGEAGDNGPDPESQPESNFQRSEGKFLLNPGFSQLNLLVGAQVYDRPKRLLTPGRGADPHDEVEEAHCDGDVREEDSAGLFNDVVQLNPILFSLRRCTSTRPRAPCGDDLQPSNSLSFPRIIITST